jgi:two-component system sensor histidine kinase RpfC
MAERCLDSGMDACIVKPVAPNELLKAIDAHASALPASASGLPAKAAEPDPPATAFSTEWALPDLPVIDWTALDGLRSLGGEEFVTDLIREFQHEADDLGQRLADATRTLDAEAFRADAHGLQSSAANLGAKALAELCRSWRHTRRADLEAEGAHRMEQLRSELTSVDALLTGHGSRTLPGLFHGAARPGGSRTSLPG